MCSDPCTDRQPVEKIKQLLLACFGPHTANEGLVRIQPNCLVPVYIFPEMKLPGLVISKKELLCSVIQFPHSCVCEQFLYSHDWSAYFAAAK